MAPKSQGGTPGRSHGDTLPPGTERTRVTGVSFFRFSAGGSGGLEIDGARMKWFRVEALKYTLNCRCLGWLIVNTDNIKYN